MNTRKIERTLKFGQNLGSLAKGYSTGYTNFRQLHLIWNPTKLIGRLRVGPGTIPEIWLAEVAGVFEFLRCFCFEASKYKNSPKVSP